MVRRLRGPLLLQLLIVAIAAAAGWLVLPYDTFAAFCLLLMWLTLAIVILRRCFAKTRDQGISTRIPAIAVVLSIEAISFWAFGFAFQTGDWHGNRSRFAAKMAGYDRTVGAVYARKWEPGRHITEVAGNWVEVDVSDVTRVMFDWNGYFSNWEGVVYDPSDQVTELKAATIEGKEPLQIRRQFGSKLGWCRHLSGHYYFCSMELA
jgi:hypothetical protein